MHAPQSDWDPEPRTHRSGTRTEKEHVGVGPEPRRAHRSAPHLDGHNIIFVLGVPVEELRGNRLPHGLASLRFLVDRRKLGCIQEKTRAQSDFKAEKKGRR